MARAGPTAGAWRGAPRCTHRAVRTRGLNLKHFREQTAQTTANRKCRESAVGAGPPGPAAKPHVLRKLGPGLSIPGVPQHTTAPQKATASRCDGEALYFKSRKTIFCP